MVHQFSGALGAFLGGVIFDQTGSYQLMMIAMIPMSLVTVLCTYFMHGTDTFKKRVLNQLLRVRTDAQMGSLLQSSFDLFIVIKLDASVTISIGSLSRCIDLGGQYENQVY